MSACLTYGSLCWIIKAYRYQKELIKNNLEWGKSTVTENFKWRNMDWKVAEFFWKPE